MGRRTAVNRSSRSACETACGQRRGSAPFTSPSLLAQCSVHTRSSLAIIALADPRCARTCIQQSRRSHEPAPLATRHLFPFVYPMAQRSVGSLPAPSTRSLTARSPCGRPAPLRVPSLGSLPAEHTLPHSSLLFSGRRACFSLFRLSPNRAVVARRAAALPQLGGRRDAGRRPRPGSPARRVLNNSFIHSFIHCRPHPGSPARRRALSLSLGLVPRADGAEPLGLLGRRRSKGKGAGIEAYASWRRSLGPSGFLV